MLVLVLVSRGVVSSCSEIAGCHEAFPYRGLNRGEMSKKKVVSIEIDTGPYASFIDRIVELARAKVSSYVCVANVHMVVESHACNEYAEIVNNSDLVTPDGMPLSKAIALLYGIKQERVAGMDLLPDILGAADKSGLSVFLYGSTDSVLGSVLSRIKSEHPKLVISGSYSPPFRALTADEASDEAASINASGAHIVLVALGCPKQERWMAANKGRVDAVMVGLGGAFPVYAGLQGRAPKIMQDLSLEWLYRLCQEPRRLFQRYLFTNTAFILLLARDLVLSKMK